MEKTERTLRSAIDVFYDIEENASLLWGLPSIIRSQIDLFNLDSEDLSDAESADLIARHEMLSETLLHVAMSIDMALDSIAGVALYEDQKAV